MPEQTLFTYDSVRSSTYLLRCHLSLALESGLVQAVVRRLNTVKFDKASSLSFGAIIAHFTLRLGDFGNQTVELATGPVDCVDFLSER